MKIFNLLVTLILVLSFVGCDNESPKPPAFYGIKGNIRLQDTSGNYSIDITPELDTTTNCKIESNKYFEITAQDGNGQQWIICVRPDDILSPIGEYKISEEISAYDKIEFVDNLNNQYIVNKSNTDLETYIKITEYKAGEKIVGSFKGIIIGDDGKEYELRNGYFNIVNFQ